jgi:hypothetical protein
LSRNYLRLRAGVWQTYWLRGANLDANHNAEDFFKFRG